MRSEMKAMTREPSLQLTESTTKDGYTIERRRRTDNRDTFYVVTEQGERYSAGKDRAAAHYIIRQLKRAK